GQRNSGNLTVFGIKNARRAGRSSGQDEFLLIGGVDEAIADGAPSRLLEQDISCRINRLQLTGCLSGMSFRSWRLLVLSAQCDNSSVGPQSRICAFQNDGTFENRLPLRVVVMEVVRQNLDRNLLPALVRLYKHCGNPCVGLGLSVQSSLFVVEVDDGRLDDVPALPSSRCSRKASRAC